MFLGTELLPDMLTPDGGEAPFMVSGTVHGRSVGIAVASPAEVLDEMSRWAGEDPDATGNWQLRSDYSSAVTAVARFKPGLVGETRRVAHLFYLLPGVPQGFVLTAHCGEALTITDVQWLPFGGGLPCEDCLRVMARYVGARACEDVTLRQVRATLPQAAYF
jgi:hypothetical protein